MLKFVKMYSL